MAFPQSTYFLVTVMVDVPSVLVVVLVVVVVVHLNDG